MKNTKAEKQLKAEKTIDLILRYIKENNLQPATAALRAGILGKVFGGTARCARSGAGTQHAEHH